MEAYSLRSRDKVTAYLSFYQALEAEAAAETTSTEVKENLEAAAAAAAEPLLCTLTLKKLMILIQAATCIYQLALAELAAKAGTDFPPEALEELLLQSLKIALVRQCVKLYAEAAMAALATPEMQQQIQLAVQAAMSAITLMVVNIILLYSF